MLAIGLASSTLIPPSNAPISVLASSCWPNCVNVPVIPLYTLLILLFAPGSNCVNKCPKDLSILSNAPSWSKYILLPSLVSPFLNAISNIASAPIDSETNGSKNSAKAPGVFVYLSPKNALNTISSSLPDNFPLA